MSTDLSGLRLAITEELQSIYGRDAQKVTDTILPAFLSDFFSMLQNASLRSLVKETYCTEDKQVTLTIEGVRQSATDLPATCIKRVSLNNKSIWNNVPTTPEIS